MSHLPIVIIGAGIVGASTALALQKDGQQVLLVDRSEPCAGASFGNAGLIVGGSCAPTAMPGIAFDGLSMLTKPLSALSIRPAYFHKILPWLMRFVAESRRANVTRNAVHLHALTNRAFAGWRQLIETTELNRLIDRGGWLKVYESAVSFSATKDSRALMDNHGVPYEVLSPAEIHDLEPNLAPKFSKGIYLRDSLKLSNPQRLVRGMVDLFVTRGGTYQKFEVHSLNTDNNRIVLAGDGTSLSARRVVIAAGAWSRRLAHQLGDNVALETERGYHLMLSTDNNRLLNRPVSNGTSNFVLCPMELGLRLTTQIEFAGLKAPPDFRRARSLLPVVRRMLPAIDTTEESAWLGFRPSLPDSLPVLGYSTKSDNVLYAFGHQHLGITLGPISGLIIADLIAGRNPGLDLYPYRPGRF